MKISSPYTGTKMKELREKATCLSSETNQNHLQNIETDNEKLIEALDIAYMELELQNQVLQETQLKFEKSRHLYHELFNCSPIGYMILDMHGIIKEVNVNAARIFGLEINQLQGLRLHMFIPVNDFVIFDKCIQKLFAENIPQSCDVHLKVEKYKWVRLRFCLHDKHSKTKKTILCSIVDISNEKEAEKILKENNLQLEKQVMERTRDLIKAREKAEKLSKTKDQFLANMSHEIRTPMNGIVGMAQMLQQTELTSQQSEFVQTILGSSESLMTIINDILDLSKVEAGKITLASEPLNIRKVIDNVIAVLATSVYEKQLEFASIISSKIPMFLYGDSVRIGQILMNLLGNAIKYTNSGEIVLHVTLEEKTASDVTIRIEISDTGIGIPDSQKHMLFEPFSQLNDNMLKKTIGTGLGLTISKRISQMMGGDIHFESIYTKGSTFWVTLHLNICEDQKCQVPTKKLKKYRILLIEPYHHRRKVFRENLTLLDMYFDETSSAINGQMMLTEAMKKNQSYDYCFVNPYLQFDKEMLFWQWLEKQSNLKSTKMIAIVSPLERTSLFSDLFSDQITKPITWTSLCRFFERKEIKKQESKSLPTQDSSKIAHANKSILIVEDDAVNQNVLKSILEKENYQVMQAYDGQQAIDLLKNTYCDLIFMDLLMPNLNGIDTTKMIRDKKTKVLNHDIPIIAMTANAMKIHEKSCLEAGMKDFLTKPVKLKEIIETVNKWLSPDENQENIANIGNMDKSLSVHHPLYNKNEMIHRLNGNMHFVEQTVDAFIKNAPLLIENLKQAIDIGDVMAMEIRAHTIKGNAINIGATSLKEMAIEMEKAARKGQIDKAASLVTSISQLVHRICQHLKKESFS